MRLVLSHALSASGSSHWYPELRETAISQGHGVDLPDLPAPDAPRPDAWRLALSERTQLHAAPEMMLVGHSIGGVNILRMLEQHNAERHGKFAAVVLVATPAHEVGYEILAEFFAKPFDWPAIRRGARKFYVLAAADDPVLTQDPFEHVALMVRELGAGATVLPGGGHFVDAQESEQTASAPVLTVMAALKTQ